MDDLSDLEACVVSLKAGRTANAVKYAQKFFPSDP